MLDSKPGGSKGDYSCIPSVNEQQTKGRSNAYLNLSHNTHDLPCDLEQINSSAEQKRAVSYDPLSHSTVIPERFCDQACEDFSRHKGSNAFYGGHQLGALCSGAERETERVPEPADSRGLRPTRPPHFRSTCKFRGRPINWGSHEPLLGFA